MKEDAINMFKEKLKKINICEVCNSIYRRKVNLSNNKMLEKHSTCHLCSHLCCYYYFGKNTYAEKNKCEPKAFDWKKIDRSQKDELRKVLIKNQKSQCYYCGQKFDESNFDIEHVIPISELKKNEPLDPTKIIGPNNIVAACSGCNRNLKRKLKVENIILPYIDNPEDFFSCAYLPSDKEYLYPIFIFPKEDKEKNLKAKEHIEKFKLNSYERVIYRLEKAKLYAPLG